LFAATFIYLQQLLFVCSSFYLFAAVPYGPPYICFKEIPKNYAYLKILQKKSREDHHLQVKST
jgi:hypothetical protein